MRDLRRPTLSANVRRATRRCKTAISAKTRGAKSGKLTVSDLRACARRRERRGRSIAKRRDGDEDLRRVGSRMSGDGERTRAHRLKQERLDRCALGTHGGRRCKRDVGLDPHATCDGAGFAASARAAARLSAECSIRSQTRVSRWSCKLKSADLACIRMQATHCGWALAAGALGGIHRALISGRTGHAGAPQLWIRCESRLTSRSREVSSSRSAQKGWRGVFEQRRVGWQLVLRCGRTE
ncbi:hypothetical protein B0H15DRAFT_862123 [Mycena belliarum]|uniref:Uncharacterized protein n=1 Tax=Mycena belliarum TaxID=1033014 RepID=A0AAD6TVY9_9AGAR|nr:hypothetical protein B0H15DRAFT_862123 [Mycena belliae]